jgi:hypothetical protein
VTASLSENYLISIVQLAATNYKAKPPAMPVDADYAFYPINGLKSIKKLRLKKKLSFSCIKVL